MRILAVNCGSSSLKVELHEVAAESDRRVAAGLVERIGATAIVSTRVGDSAERTFEEPIADHAAAVRRLFEAMAPTPGSPLAPEAVVHRVVHGGERFTGPARLDDATIAEIAALLELAPLHNAPALEVIRAVRSLFGSSLPAAAVFDTAFGRSLPPRASEYAIETHLAREHRVHRYGFHGSAHRSMIDSYVRATGRPMGDARLITFQLGNGCSVAASVGGRAIDTSMGFTPLEGLVMGTRSGDIDPSVVSYLARREGVDAAAIEDRLNRRSGLLGVSGSSRDMRDLLKREHEGDGRAALAVEMFCYRAKKYLGAYLAALGGANAVIFGGGIGEHSPEIRSRICEGMTWWGLSLDPTRNTATVGVEGSIAAEASRVDVRVACVDEAGVMVREAYTLFAAH